MPGVARFFAACAALSLTCSACTATEQSPRATHPIQTPTHTADGDPAHHEAVLEDPDPAQRPAGIDEQLRFPVGGGGENCFEQEEFALHTHYETEAREYGYPEAPNPDRPHLGSIPFSTSFCVLGSDRSKDVRVTLTSPFGKIVEQSNLVGEYDPRPSDEITNRDAFFHAFLPGDEEGEYTLTARQGNRSATRIIRVGRASKPKVFLASGDPSDRSKGGKVAVAFGGLPPSGAMQFHLYRNAPENQGKENVELAYHATYKITGNSSGYAFLTLRITERSLPGFYYLTNQPGLQLQGTAATWTVK